MLEEHQPLFGRLCEERDMVAVSGAQESQIRAQIPHTFDGQYFILAQNGNHCIDKNGSTLWKKELDDPQTRAIITFIEKVHSELRLKVKDENDLVENRGAQISYSLIGHHEDLEKKNAFDPNASRRLDILAQHADAVEELKKNNVEVKTGGTTTFDFFPLGNNKGYNIAEFLKNRAWEPHDCIYIGDALFPGGNDETVVGIIPTHAVKDYHETYEYLKSVLSS